MQWLERSFLLLPLGEMATLVLKENVGAWQGKNRTTYHPYDDETRVKIAKYECKRTNKAPLSSSLIRFLKDSFSRNISNDST